MSSSDDDLEVGDSPKLNRSSPSVYFNNVPDAIASDSSPNLVDGDMNKKVVVPPALESTASMIVAAEAVPVADEDVVVPAAAIATTTASGKDDGKDGSDKKKAPAPSEKVSFFGLFRYADCLDVLLLSLGCFSSIGRGAILPAFSFVFGGMIDALSDNSDVSAAVARLVFVFLYIGVAAFVLTFVQVYCFQLTSERQVHRIRLAYLRSIMRQDMAWFDKEGLNELYTRMSDDILKIGDSVGDKIGVVLQFFSTFVAGFGLGFYQGWELTLVILACTPFLALSGAFMMKFMAEMTTAGLQAYSKAGAIALEVLGSVRTVAAFGQEEKEMKRYADEVRGATKVNSRKGFIQGMGFGFVMLFMFLTYAVGLYVGAVRISDRNSGWTGGTVITVFFAVIMGAFGLGQVAPPLGTIATGQGAAFAVFKIIERKSDIDALSAEGEKVSRTTCKGKIELQKVTFRYPTRPAVTVLNNLSLTIHPGKKVALVGPSGCGKSSIIQLLQRLYDPESGSISIDDRPIKDLNVASYRGLLGLVSQEPVLFSGTISENIAYGFVGTPTQEQIIIAAKSANAHDFIMKFPKQYETLCGSKGTQLSGGQKQRIAIARAILLDPPILLLDEATSALDTQSEKIVQQTLDALMKNRTTVVIAHRLATIQDADIIHVLDQGNLVQSGSFDELVSQESSMFAEMVKAQGMASEEKEGAVGAEDQTETDSKGKELIEEVTAKVAEKGSEKTESSSTTTTASSSSSSKKKPSKKKKSTAKGDEDDEEQLDLDDDPTLPDVKGPLGKVLGMSGPEVHIYVVGILGAIVNGAIMPAFSFMFAEILQAFYPTPSEIVVVSVGPPLVFATLPSFYDNIVSRATPWVIAFVVLAVSAFVANFLQIGMFGLGGERLTERLRVKTYSALLRNEIYWFDDPKHSAAVLTTKLATDATLVQGIIGGNAALIVQNLVTLVGGLGIAFWFSWKITLVCFAVAPLLVIGQVVEFAAMKGLSSGATEHLSHANATASESITNIKIVRAFVAEQKVMAKYSTQLAKPHRIGKCSSLTTAVIQGIGQFAQFAGYSIMFWYGGKLISDGEIKFIDVMKSLMAVMMTAMGVGQAASFAGSASKGQPAAKAIMRLLYRQSLIDPLGTTGVKPPTESVAGNIQVQDIHFVYPQRPDAPILKGLSVSVPAGKVLALVGESGSGKSTIILCLERFYPLKSGSISIDGVDITQMNLQHLRQQISLVSQEPILFTGTVAQNIAYGLPNATTEQIQQAAKDANAHNFISAFPLGYETFLGEGGTQLSGGQKQRIAIARAILRNPKILLLDEATSALDTKSEKVVQAALDRVMKGRTTIVIAHRLSTIKEADIIAVIKGGVIVEQGSHKELMAKKANYYNLVKRQTKRS